MTTADDTVMRFNSGWAPAPGSVVRHYWPLPVRWAWWLAHRPLLVAVVAVAVLVGVKAGPVVLGVIVAAVAVALVVWWRAHPVTFNRFGGRVLLGLWRSFWAYGVRWRTAMMLSGLGGRFNGQEYVPRVVRVRAGRFSDRVTVRMVVGQQPEDWSRRLDALAHGFGARSCQVCELPRRPGYLQLVVGRLDPLAQVVAVPAPVAVDLGAVQLGRREDGRDWTVRLRGSHTLIAGATGAGKGSVLWSLIRALGPAIRDGLVRLWVLDPKGGMELAAGAPLFDRFAYDSAAAMADVLEDAVSVMQERAGRLRGRTRLHTPDTDEPLIAVVVDELASLTAYAERDDRRRISAALSLLLSQGRAVGVVVVAALQDPRKEVLPFRDLFPTRIALALVEAEQTDLVLGRGARVRGADCSRIPLTTPGIGWVWCDGEPEPARVRAGWVSDTDIAAMVEAFTPATPAPTVEDGPVVIDLTDKTRDAEREREL
jgi:DNA segregation ATPase FtsK/SpoIIIE, S-DNA-T family